MLYETSKRAAAGDEPGALPFGTQRQVSELRFLVLAAQREGNRQLAQALREIGLTPAQAEVITVLEEQEPLTLAALGRYIVCETGSPSRLVDSLVKKGLVERESGQSDRRVVHLRLTAEARALGEHIKKIDDAIDSVILDRLAGHDVQPVIDALHRIVCGTNAGSKVAHRFPPEQ
ncbi:MAG: MarR family winged helix-turn-helix transcriptional regulator [Streptomyces sp.]|uniref:MarR family winged helix-turn-helix transcriptional regulator n=1 Tax=Streptomyces sp. TaxID=1931 RepID=UPI003D6AE251